jgi:hypothetical protein
VLRYKRLSTGRFLHWPSSPASAPGRALLAHELAVLLRGGDFEKVGAAPEWRPVRPA